MASASIPNPNDRAKRRRPLQYALLALVAVTPIVVSYVRAVERPGHSTFRLRSGLWLRDHYLSHAVDLVEWCWYTIRRSHTVHGSRPSESTIHPDTLSSGVKLAEPKPAPASLRCIVRKCDTSEGRWHSLGADVEHAPALYVTYFRPDPEHEDVWAAAVLVDSSRARARVVAGTREPLDFRGAWGGAIPREQRGRLIAAFNGGFRFADAGGGFFAENRVGAPLIEGAASLVVYRDGRADVGVWGDDVRMNHNVVAVRQNLKPIVIAGHIVKGLDRNENGEWGAGWNQGLYTWRSGLGTTADNQLVYIAGDGLTLLTLADALVQAHCIRGMELDIHDMWITFEVYAQAPDGADGVVGQKLLRGMALDDRRYLLPDDKDFVALFAR